MSYTPHYVVSTYTVCHHKGKKYEQRIQNGLQFSKSKKQQLVTFSSLWLIIRPNPGFSPITKCNVKLIEQLLFNIIKDQKRGANAPLFQYYGYVLGSLEHWAAKKLMCAYKRQEATRAAYLSSRIKAPAAIASKANIVPRAGIGTLTNRNRPVMMSQTQNNGIPRFPRFLLLSLILYTPFM